MRVSPSLVLGVAMAASSAAPARAEAGAVSLQFDPPAGPLHLELPVLDLPANAHGYVTQPSMEQSKWIAEDLYELAHFGIGAGLGADSPWAVLAVAGVDTVSVFFTLPFTGLWQHEEWHRAILTLHGIDSVNPFYRKFTIPLFDPVSIDLDAADLRAFKRDHPADYVHGLVAGFEAQYALARDLEKNAFFHPAARVSGLTSSILYAVATTYAFLCAGGQSGGDCVLWADGLFAPAAPPRQEGAEIPEEQASYLGLQAILSLVNFLDPFIGMVRSFDDDGHRFNVAARYYPTPFGSAGRLDGFYARGRLGLLLTLDAYVNHELGGPGLGAELIPLPLGAVTLGGRASLWLQPVDQSFWATGLRPGGAVAARVGVPLDGGRVEPYVELDAKTSGWVLGNPFLTASASVRTGLALSVF